MPRLSIVLRKGYGLDYVAMCGGRGFGADTCYAWPTAPDPAAHRTTLVDGFMGQLGAVRAAKHFGIVDVIDPRDARRPIIETLRTAPPRRQLNLPPRYRSIAPI